MGRVFGMRICFRADIGNEAKAGRGLLNQFIVGAAFGDEERAAQILERDVALPRAHIDREHRCLRLPLQLEVRAQGLEDFGLKIEMRIARSGEMRILFWVLAVGHGSHVLKSAAHLAMLDGRQLL